MNNCAIVREFLQQLQILRGPKVWKWIRRNQNEPRASRQGEERKASGNCSDWRTWMLCDQSRFKVFSNESTSFKAPAKKQPFDRGSSITPVT